MEKADFMREHRAAILGAHSVETENLELVSLPHIVNEAQQAPKKAQLNFALQFGIAVNSSPTVSRQIARQNTVANLTSSPIMNDLGLSVAKFNQLRDQVGQRIEGCACCGEQF